MLLKGLKWFKTIKNLPKSTFFLKQYFFFFFFKAVYNIRFKKNKFFQKKKFIKKKYFEVIIEYFYFEK